MSKQNQLFRFLVLAFVFDHTFGQIFITNFNKRPNPALLSLNDTLPEKERKSLLATIHRTYKVSDYDDIREDLRISAPRFYSIIADLDSAARNYYDARLGVSRRRLELLAEKAGPDNVEGATTLAHYLNEQLELIGEIIRKEMLFKFMEAGNNMNTAEAAALRKIISDKFRFNTIGEIFGDFERGVPAMYEAVLEVSERLAKEVGNLEPGTPEKYLTESSLGEHETSLLVETFAEGNADIAIVLCTCIVQTINRMTDEELIAAHGVPREDIALSAARWPFSIGALNQTEIARFALKFNSTMGTVLLHKTTETKRLIAIEFDEDQQIEFIERLDILHERIQQFLVQFAIISLMQTIQKLEPQDVIQLRRYVSRKSVYSGIKDTEQELSSAAPELLSMLVTHIGDLEELFKDRLTGGLIAIDNSWSKTNPGSLAAEIEADLAPIIFEDIARAYGAFATTILVYLREQTQRTVLRLANEAWLSERPKILRVMHTMTTKHHRVLLREMRRSMPSVYVYVGPFHLLMEGKRRSSTDPEVATLIEIMRAEGVRLFIARIAGMRGRDRLQEEPETFFGRHFNAFDMIRYLRQDQLEKLTRSFRLLTPEQRDIFDNIAL